MAAPLPTGSSDQQGAPCRRACSRGRRCGWLQPIGKRAHAPPRPLTASLRRQQGGAAVTLGAGLPPLFPSRATGPRGCRSAPSSPPIGGGGRGAVIVREAGAGREAGGREGCGGGGMASCRRLSGAGLREVLGPAQGLLFDCDGVLWAGERAVPGAPELLERLRRSGKAALFVSNNSRRSVAELERRFSRLGFRGVRAEHVFSSALCSALFLRQRLLGGGGDGGNGTGGGRVFVLGGEGLRGEVRDAGLRLAGEGEPAAGAAEPVRAVLVGYDDQFTFAKLAQACGYLRDPQCLLVATDPDPWHPLSDGQRTPGEPAAPALMPRGGGTRGGRGRGAGRGVASLGFAIPGSGEVFPGALGLPSCVPAGSPSHIAITQLAHPLVGPRALSRLQPSPC